MGGTHLPRSPAWDVDSTAPVALLRVAPSAFLGCFSFLAVVCGRSGFHSWNGVGGGVRLRGLNLQSPPNLPRIPLYRPVCILTSNCGQFMGIPGPLVLRNHLRSSWASAPRMACSSSR